MSSLWKRLWKYLLQEPAAERYYPPDPAVSILAERSFRLSADGKMTKRSGGVTFSYTPTFYDAS